MGSEQMRHKHTVRPRSRSGQPRSVWTRRQQRRERRRRRYIDIARTCAVHAVPSHTHEIFRSRLSVAAQAAAEETAAVESAKAAIVRRNVENLRRALQPPSALRARVVRAVLKQLATSGWSEGTEAVLHMGVDVNSVDADGRTLLHHAAERGDCSTVDVLLARSCKVGARSTSGRTPLHEATYNGHLEVMRRLL